MLESFDLYLISRSIASFMVGVLLSLSGSSIQLLTQNPLASPSTLGLTTISVLVIMFTYTLNAFDIISTPNSKVYLLILSIIFVILFLMTHLKKQNQTLIGNRYSPLFPRYILIGISVSLLVASLFSLFHFAFMVWGKEFPSMLWFGQIHTFERENLSLFFILSIFLYVRGFFLAKNLRFLAFGYQWAQSIGINVQKLEKQTMLFSLACVSLVICFFGVFSFLGLIFPHALRQMNLFKKNIFLELTIGSILCGIILLILDQMCYHFPISGAEIPVGMITSVIGPILLIFILKPKSQNKKSFVENIS